MRTGAARSMHHWAIRHPGWIQDQNFVAGIKRSRQRQIQRPLAAGRHEDVMRGEMVYAVLFCQLGNNGF